VPPKRKLPGLNVNKLRIDDGLQMRFSPSIGISARNLDKFGLDIRSFREPLKRSIQQVLAPSFRKNFDAQGRPIPWAPLAEFTVEKRGTSEPILNRSGLLKRTIQQLNIWSLDSEKAAITDLPQKIWYGKLHQAGYKGTGKATFSFPERPFVMIQGEDYDDIERVFMEWLQERAVASKAFKIDPRG
jgi:phage gpG-like protein